MRTEYGNRILVSQALGIPLADVTQDMIEDLRYGLEIMDRTPSRYTSVQYLEAARQVLAHYKERRNGKRKESRSTTQRRHG